MSRIPPIVAMTAFSLEDDRDKLLSAGLDYYLAKPITAEKLITKIKKVIGLSSDMSDDLGSTNNSIDQDSEVLNMAIVNQLEGIGGKEMLEEVYSEFVEESDELIIGMSGQTTDEGLAVILGNLHTIKGLSGTIGITGVERLSKKIESNLKNDQFDEYEELFVQLCEAYEFFKLNYKHLLGIE